MQRQVPPGYQYMHLIATNPELPNFIELQQALPPFVQIVEVLQTDRLHEALNPAIAYYAAGREYFSFRLDDDDALTPNYLQLVVDNWHRKLRSITAVDGWYIGINRRRAGGQELRMVKAFNAGSPHGTGAYNDNIHSLGKHNAIPGTGHITAPVYWLRTVHRSNVTLAGHAGTPWGRKDTDVAPELVLPKEFPHLSQAAMTAALRLDPVTL